MYSLDIVGYLASGLVFATFYMTEMLPLRLVAIASNLAFIAYGYLGEMTPILLLHVWLLPLNVWRLYQTLAAERQADRGLGRHYAIGDASTPQEGDRPCTPRV